MQGCRIMRFEEVYEGWHAQRLSQAEAAQILGVCERSFRRYIARYEEGDGDLKSLADRRLSQASKRKAPDSEITAVTSLYSSRFVGWNVQHFCAHYRREMQALSQPARSYSWVRTVLQGAGLVRKAAAKGQHHKKRDPKPLVGMMVHQDASTHEWVPGKRWDLVVTMDDATGEHLSMFFCTQEGTASSLHGMGQSIARYGLFCSLYTDRGAHYFTTPVAQGKVDKVNLTQVGRACRDLGIEHIAAYSPQARGRSERAFRTHQDRLVKELAQQGIDEMAQANAYLEAVYRVQHNKAFARAAASPGSAFVPYLSQAQLADMLCEKYERVVGNDNTVRFEGLSLQIPEQQVRYSYSRTHVWVHRYVDATLSVWHGPRLLARFDEQGEFVQAVVTQTDQRLAA
jgi:transcriptional regulator with XRE-family HTH domain